MMSIECQKLIITVKKKSIIEETYLKSLNKLSQISITVIYGMHKYNNFSLVS